MANTNTMRYLIEVDVALNPNATVVLSQVQRSVEGIGGAMKPMTDTMNRAGVASKQLGINIGGLVARSMLVIPVWMAMRSAFSSVINTVRESIQHIKELDSAIARIASVTQGIKDPAGFLKEMKSELRGLSMQSGTTVKDLAEAFYKFGEGGLNAVESLAGMKTAMTTSIATMDDMGQTARSIADIYRTMGGGMNDALTPFEKMKTIGSTMSFLWKQNAYELKEFEDGMKGFVGSARTYNISLDDTMLLIAQLNTLMQRGGTSGTQMARAFDFMSKNMDKVEMVIGPQDRQNMDYGKTFFSLIGEFSKRQKAGEDINPELTEIFGMRARRGIASLVSTYDTFIKQKKELASLSLADRIARENELYEIQSLTIDRQLKRFREAKQVAGEMFINALTGTDDYALALKKIADFTQNQVVPAMITLGLVIRRVGEAAIETFGWIEKISSFTFAGQVVKKAMADRASSSNTSAGIKEVGRAHLNKIDNNTINKYIESSGTSYKDLSYTIGLLSRQGNVKGLTDIYEKMGLNQDQKIKALNLEEAGKFLSTKATESAADKAEQEKQDYRDQLDVLVEKRTIEEQIADLLDTKAVQLEREGKFYDYFNVLGYEAVEIEELKLRKMVEVGATADEQAKQAERVLEERQRSLEKYGMALKDNFEGAFTEFLKGATTAEEAFKNLTTGISDNFIGNIGKGLTNTLARTGLFSQGGYAMQGLMDAFGSANDKIQFAHENALRQGATYIRDAHIKGITEGFAKARSYASSGGTTSIGGAGGLIPLMGYDYSGGMNAPYFDPATQSYVNPPSGSQALVAARGKGAGWKNLQSGMEVGALGVSSALTGYSMYQQTNRNGNNQMMGVASGLMAGLSGTMTGLASMGASGALTGALGGMVAAAPWLGPVGLALGLGAVAASLFQSPADADRPANTSYTTTSNVTSRIDTTNKQLEIVNRNLVALRSDIQTYILPNSSYFSEVSNIEDSFSVNARRGMT